MSLILAGVGKGDNFLQVKTETFQSSLLAGACAPLPPPPILQCSNKKDYGFFENFYRAVIAPLHAWQIVDNSGLLWQKEASDVPSKSELLMLSYFTVCAFLPGQINVVHKHSSCYMLGKTWYSIDVTENDRHVLLFYKKSFLVTCYLLQSRAGFSPYMLRFSQENCYHVSCDWHNPVADLGGGGFRGFKPPPPPWAAK